MFADLTYSQALYITPSLDSPCPHNDSSCFTLSQFAANSSNNETDLSLIFLPGYHTLEQELLLNHGYNFSISKYSHDNESVFVECISQLGRFDISEAVSVSITSLHFIGCGSNRISQVTWLTIADSTFQGVIDKNTVLVLSEVVKADIVQTWFLYNTLTHHDDKSRVDFNIVFEALNYVYHLQNTSSGVLYTAFSNASIVSCRFMYNRADIGGALVARNSSLHIDKSTHNCNTANFGGTIVTSGSTIVINNSIFSNNSAQSGGVMLSFNDSFNIASTTFSENFADKSAGVIMTISDSSFTINNCNFTSNSAYRGGVIYSYHDSPFTISNSNFTSNRANDGGVMRISGNSSLNISDCNFNFNNAVYGGVMITYDKCSFSISNSNFTFNHGTSSGVMIIFDNSLLNISKSNFFFNTAVYGGAMLAYGNSLFTISNSNFTSNSATTGSVIYISKGSSFIISDSNFKNNNATSIDGVIRCSDGTMNVHSSNFSSNTVNTRGGGMIFVSQCSINIANSAFDDNVGSIYTLDSNLTISGNSNFKNFTELLNARNESASQRGGAITSFQSTVIFTRKSTTQFSNNRERDGGAILAIESTILMFRDTTVTIANSILTHTIANSSGGGISLKQSRLEINGKFILVNNSAVRGGGIHASSSTIAVHQSGILQIVNNNAGFGGGIYLEVNSKLYVLKTSYSHTKNLYHLNFIGNHANYGGAVYVADDTNSGTCSSDDECFMQSLAVYQFDFAMNEIPSLITENILFSENTASEQGSDLFGGLLDRCIPSPFAEVYRNRKLHYGGISYLQNISNIQLQSIMSQPLRICFCNGDYEPDCNYQIPTITVKKGENFNVSIVAVDQINNTVDANITSFTYSFDVGFGEGQQIQSVGRYCTDLKYNVFSPYDSVTINLFADGPCRDAALSTSHVIIHFTDCTCPIGFEPLSNSEVSTRCECVCDSKLSPYITKCNVSTSSVYRIEIDTWIGYINNTDLPGHIKYTNCPFDYCKPSTENISINFNLPDGADTQCAYNRTGVLCGSCRGKFSLSLASSRCLPCHSHWPAVCVLILLGAIFAGVLLVTALFALNNMTVSVGLINGFIFYANIVSARSAVFFPSSEPGFPSVFVAWLNLDIEIDVCFIDGLDTYSKTWLQLAFPIYIISLVVLLIIVSEYSSKFAGLIGRRDPISTLATLILLSYAKLLSVTITALSFASLDYPGGKRDIIWLLDGNVKYFQR